MKNAAWVIAACVAIGFGAPVDAALTAGQKTAAEALIRQFSAAEFDVRQQAVEKLVALGPDVAALVKKTLDETTDNEVKLRCRMVLKALGVDESAPADKEKPNYDASRVTIDLDGAALSEALQTLADQSGNAPVKADAFPDRKATARLKDVPYWEAFDRVCESAGLVYQPGLWRGTVPTLVAAKAKGPTLSAYPGPFVIWIDRTQRTANDVKTLSMRTDTLYGVATTPASRWVTLQTRVAIEDRLAAAGYRATFTAALTPDGKNVLPKLPVLPVAARALRGPSWADRSPSLNIPDAPEPIKGPLTIEGRIDAEFPVDRREVRVEDVFSPGKKSAGDDALTLEDVVVDRRQNLVRVSLTFKADDAHKGLVGYDMPKGYGFSLLDPEGKPCGNVGGWSSTGEAVAIDFRSVPDIPGKWTLVLAYPGSLVEKQYPFTIKDVPLP